MHSIASLTHVSPLMEDRSVTYKSNDFPCRHAFEMGYRYYRFAFSVRHVAESRAVYVGYGVQALV